MIYTENEKCLQSGRVECFGGIFCVVGKIPVCVIHILSKG